MPLYQQLEEQLATLIGNGSLREGSTLPAERYLAEALGISRATVQRCYNTLRERGLIRGQGRHGSIIRGDVEKLLPGMDRLKGFTQEMQELGRTASTRVIEHQILTDRPTASLFGLPSTSRFLKLIRIRLGDDIPLSRETAWYSIAAAPFLADADVRGSIYGQLTEHGLSLSHCDQTIEAAAPTAEECRVFGFAEPIPCLLIKRRTYAQRGVMVEYVEGLFRGDAYTYRLRLNA
jgi:GntR family transcriptional regulator